jgi:16S rRNA (cytosine967-C5)-methyltransferase
MKYAEKHIATATTLIASYDGTMPLSNYLKQYFAANKKFGSKDRKQIAHFCFLYYRVSNAIKSVSIGEIITIALFICEDSLEKYVSLFTQDWLTNWQKREAKRISFIQSIYPNFNIENVFSLVNELSEGMENTAFCISHLTQPDLFLRIRTNKKATVLKKLDAAGISYLAVNNCLTLPNNSKIDDILQIDREVVVQDYSSQRIAEFLSFLPSTTNYQPSTFSVWDCCAASGGKSILAMDVLGNIILTVSDIRQSIIQNLVARFARAGISEYKSFVADLTMHSHSFINNHQSQAISQSPHTNRQFPITNYQLIICDAPCTGSGTWGRTPEQLYFFKQTEIEKYAKLQRKIVANTLPHLSANGYFLYITCSVFKQENEVIVNFIMQQNPLLELVKHELLIGYTKKADTMFAALFHLQNK